MPVSVGPRCFFQPLFSDALIIGEVGKLLGAKWKELDEEDKQVHSSHLTKLLPVTNIS